jgi:hypothetical protein
MGSMLSSRVAKLRLVNKVRLVLLVDDFVVFDGFEVKQSPLLVAVPLYSGERKKGNESRHSVEYRRLGSPESHPRRTLVLVMSIGYW